MNDCRSLTLTVALAFLLLGCLQPGSFSFPQDPNGPTSQSSSNDESESESESEWESESQSGSELGSLPSQAPHSASRRVFVNDARITDAEVTALERSYQIQIADGRYWYDRFSGATGSEGGPCAGFIVAGLALGGPMQAQCSGGGTGVFLNGREAHRLDVIALQRLLPVLPGRYWVDAQGNAGYEGGPALCNLVALARAQAPAGGGGGYGPMYEGGAIHSGPFGTVGGDGKTFYFSDGKSSVIVGD